MINLAICKRAALCFLLIYLTLFGLQAQNLSPIKWYNPEDIGFPVLEGQGWEDDLQHFYDRLPSEAEKMVRPPVWRLSQNTAGMKIRFRTKATDIYVRYTVGGSKSFPHMPATGVSGVDLYAVGKNGNWEWAGGWKGGFHFEDTVKYHYSALPDGYEREYHLYLPLYNDVKWMEIGTSDSSSIEFLPKRKEKPIVVYGTSIAQGACASRPGNAWTSLLERKMNNPLINLAFSGNGQLEDAMTTLLLELDPKIYILDCMPNMARFPDDTITDRLKRTVLALKSHKPEVPVLLVEDADEFPDFLSRDLYKEYRRVNRLNKEVFDYLMASGIRGIYYLSTQEIGLDIESTVAGVHPNDYGMQLYAKAYEQKIREILNEPKGQLTTTVPVIQYRSGKGYDWEARHERILELNRKNSPKIAFLGNSITHYWGGEPDESSKKRGVNSWNKYFEPSGVRNMGFGWDRIENVLWRVYHGELDGYEAKQVIINIGTNNLSTDSNEDIVKGLRFLIHAVKERQPKASILLLGIYPRRKQEDRIADLNKRINRMADEEQISHIDPGVQLLDSSGKIVESYFVDGLHPNEQGYQILGAEIAPYLKK